MTADPDAPDELPPDVRALLEHERVIPSLEPAAVDRLHRRLSDAIDGPGSGGGGPEGGGPGGARSTGTSGAAGTAGLGSRLAMLGLGLGLGAAAGIAGTLAWQERSAESSVEPTASPSTSGSQTSGSQTSGSPTSGASGPVNSSPPRPSGRPRPPRRPELPAEPSGPGPADPPPEPSGAGTERVRPAGPRGRPAAATPPSDPQAAERRLLDAARSAITRGHPAEGMSVLRRHARRHPSGSLSEERDALRIRALIELGRITEARDEAERFFAEHPRSLFRRGLEARLERATER